LPEFQRPDSPAGDKFGRIAILWRGEFLNQAEVALAVMGEEAMSDQFAFLAGDAPQPSRPKAIALPGCVATYARVR
jgi:hypothetical protein